MTEFADLINKFGGVVVLALFAWFLLRFMAKQYEIQGATFKDFYEDWSKYLKSNVEALVQVRDALKLQIDNMREHHEETIKKIEGLK